MATGGAGDAPDWSRELFDLLEEIVVGIDAGGRIFAVNLAGCAILGATREALLGEDWFRACVPKAERVRVRGVFDRLMRGDLVPVEHFENHVLTASGEQRLVKWHNKVLRDAHDRPTGTLSAGIDISDLRFSEDRFRSFMDHSPLIACIKDRAGIIRYGNRAWAARLGAPLEDLVGKAEPELYSPEQLRRFRQSDRRVFDDGETVDMTEQGSVVHGEQSWWRVIKFPIGHAGGERLLGLFAWNVSDRVAMQGALLTSEAYAKAVLDTAVDAIATIDTRGTIKSFNRAAVRMFGYRSEEVIGRNVRMLMPAPYRDSHDGYLSSYLSTGDARIIGIGREAVAQRKDGSLFPIHLSVSEVIAGSEHGFTGIIKDLTQEKAREEELRRREAESREQRERLAHVTRVSMLGEMAAGIAHEINQPLTAIATYMQACQRLLREGSESTGDLMEVMARVDAQAQRAGEIIRRLRTLIRHAPSERRRMDLNEVVRESVALVEYEGRLQGVVLETRLQPRLPALELDAIQIQQVLLNLIHNAVEAMHGLGPGERRVRLQTRRADGEVCVEVRDHGEGLAPDAAQRLFEPFYTTKPSGMGMGLSICRSIVAAHGGRLDYRGEDLGTTFTVCLPLPGDARA